MQSPCGGVEGEGGLNRRALGCSESLCFYVVGWGGRGGGGRGGWGKVWRTGGHWGAVRRGISMW